MSYTDKEVRDIKWRTEQQSRLDILSHLVGNNYIDAYDMSEVLECYSLEPKDLKEYTLSYHDDEDTKKYFEELYYECGLLCSDCEEELDEDELCSNTDCFLCDDAYLSEEELEKRESEYQE